MKIIFYILTLSLFITTTYADTTVNLATSLKLYGGTKAKVQWERIFSSKRRMVKYNLDTLSIEELENLKNYLINHAADSEQPIVPGL